MSAEAGANRRNAIVAERVAETGVDEAMIAGLIQAFYARVRADALLGPVFEAHIADWDEHLARLTAFWSSIALMSGRYGGKPMQAHLPLDIGPRHFERWIALFAETAAEVCPPAAAAFFADRARQIGAQLQATLAAVRAAP